MYGPYPWAFPARPNTSVPIAGQTEATYQNWKKTQQFDNVGLFLINYVVSGGYVTKNIKKNDRIDISYTEFVLDSSLQKRDAVQGIKLNNPNSTYFVDIYQGDYWIDTNHPPGTEGENYISLATVTTDEVGNVNIISDVVNLRGGLITKKEYPLLGILSVTSFGAKGDSIKDDTAAIQKALDYARDHNFSHVILPDGYYRITNPLIVHSGITIGSFTDATTLQWTPADSTAADGGKPSNQLKGAWLFCDLDVADNAIQLSERGSVDGIGFYYPGNTWDKWTAIPGDVYPYGVGYQIFTPVAFAPAIKIDSPFNVVKNCFFINVYDCIEVHSGQHVKLHNLKITPIHCGIKVINNVAHMDIDMISIYPYWAEAYGYVGNSMRPNLYSEVHGAGMILGDNSNQTVEQVNLSNINIIGPADGMIMAGKGVQGVNIKVDNSFRCITVETFNNSSYHNLANVWCSSFASQLINTPTTVSDGTMYGIKVKGGGTFNLVNYQMPRADGIGLFAENPSFGTNLSQIYIESCRYRGIIIGSDSANSYRASLHTATVHCALTTTVPFTFKTLFNSDISDLKWLGATPTQIIDLQGPANAYNRFDFTTLNIATRSEYNAPIGFYADGTPPIYSRTLSSSVPEDLNDTDVFWGAKYRAGNNDAEVKISVANANTFGNSGSIAKIKARRPSSNSLDTLIALDNQVGAVYNGFDNLHTLGTASNRWKEFYCANGTINTSDERLKKDITDSNLGLSFIESLRPVVYKWKSQGIVKDGEITTREGVRPHYGLIAQEVKSVMDSLGIDFAGYISDVDGNGQEVLGLRYTEFIGPLIKAVQELSSKVKSLEQK